MRALSSWLLLICLALGCNEPATVTDAGTDAGPRPDAGGWDAGGPPPEDFEGYVRWQMAAGGIPGAAVAVIRPDGSGFLRTFGYANVESETPVEEHTLFIMASVSKTFAAVRAMQLVESGALDLDAPVNDYLPFEIVHPDHPDVDITMRMLLTHVSGLVDDFTVLGLYAYEGDPELTMQQFCIEYATPSGDAYERHWANEPVTRRDYCNAAFGIVGAGIEGAGGASFSEQTQEGILGPLALDGAGWFLRDIETGRLATPYGWNGHSFYELPPGGYAFYPASSLRISVFGLARFARALLNHGDLDGTRILSDASVDELLRIQYPDVSRGQALTFSERRVGGHLYIGHSGSTGGGSNQFLLSRDLGHAIVLLTNSDAYIRSRLGLNEGDDAMERILERLDEEALALP